MVNIKFMYGKYTKYGLIYILYQTSFIMTTAHVLNPSDKVTRPHLYSVNACPGLFLRQLPSGQKALFLHAQLSVCSVQFICALHSLHFYPPLPTPGLAGTNFFHLYHIVHNFYLLYITLDIQDIQDTCFQVLYFLLDYQLLYLKEWLNFCSSLYFPNN